MLSRMTSKEVSEWIAFYHLEQDEIKQCTKEAAVKSKVDNLTQKVRELK